MRKGKRLIFIGVLSALLCMVLAAPGYSIMGWKSDVQGELMFNGVLRDTDGFQYGFCDNTDWVQARTQLKLDVLFQPDFTIEPKLKLDKVFVRFRGAYDAIYDFTDDYDGLPWDRATGSAFDFGKREMVYQSDLRECFADIDYTMESGWYANLRLGRQIVQWGEAGLFNVINVVNPQDLSALRNFDNPDDLAYPIWMGKVDVASGAVGPFNELNFQVLWIPDNRPTIFGADTLTGSSPYSLVPGLEVRQNDVSSDMGTAQGATRIGFSAASLRAYAYYYDGFSNGPALDFVTGGILAGTGATLFIDHPRQKVYGASFNYDFGSWVLRGEHAYTDEAIMMDFSFSTPLNTKGYDFFEKHETLIGIDTSFMSEKGFPGAGGSPLSASFEIYRRFIDGYEYNALTRSGADEENWRITYAFNTFFLHGALLVVYAGIYDFEEVALQVLSGEYTQDGRLYGKIAFSATFGDTTAPSDFAPLIGSSEIAFRIGYRF